MVQIDLLFPGNPEIIKTWERKKSRSDRRRRLSPTSPGNWPSPEWLHLHEARIHVPRRIFLATGVQQARRPSRAERSPTIWEFRPATRLLLLSGPTSNSNPGESMMCGTSLRHNMQHGFAGHAHFLFLSSPWMERFAHGLPALLTHELL